MYELPASKFDGIVEVSTDVAFLNKIANTEGVREHIGAKDAGYVDLAPLLDRSIALVTEGGFYIFERKTFTTYEFHSAFLPEYRGKHAYMAARAACEHMFLKTPAIELHTRTPHDNPTATPPKTFGFREWFTDKENTFYRLHIMDWARKAKTLESWGEWFHDCLEDMRQRRGINEPLHDHDPNNNRYAGLTIGMVRGEQPEKGVVSYNHWACTAGYEPAQLLGKYPTTIFTGDAVVRYADNMMEFI